MSLSAGEIRWRRDATAEISRLKAELEDARKSYDDLAGLVKSNSTKQRIMTERVVIAARMVTDATQGISDALNAACYEDMHKSEVAQLTADALLALLTPICDIQRQIDRIAFSLTPHD